MIFAATKWLAGHRLAVLGFAVAAGYWPTFLQGAFAPRWMVIAVGVPLCCAIDPRAIPEGLRWVLAWLFALAVIATSFASPDPMTGYFELIFMFMLAVTFVAAASMDNLDDVMMGLATGLAVSSVMVAINLNSNDQRDSGDISGLFFNSEVLAEFAALVFVWAVARPRILTAAICSVPLLFCGSRISIVVALVGALFAYRPNSKLLTAGLFAIIAAAGVALIVVMGIDKMHSAEHRVTLWIAMVFAWNQYGHGLGWFLTHYPLEQFGHSDAIQMIAELGVGAFAAVAIPIYAFCFQGGNRAERALFLAVCIEVCVSFPLHLPASGFVAALAAGRLVGSGYGLRLHERHRRDDDGAGVQRRAAEIRGLAGEVGRLGEAIPVRSVSAPGAALRAPEAGRG